MCIYCGTYRYRKIYENHYGSIPKDENNRTFDIHHIDGNRNNNIPENLIALSVKDHYDLHYSKGEYGSAWLIARKLRLTPEQLSEISRLNAKQQIKNGTNKFAGESGSILSKAVQRRLIDSGNHILLSGKVQKEYHQTALKNGTHHSQVKWICGNCGLNGKSKSNYKRHLKICLSEVNNLGKIYCWENIKTGEKIMVNGHDFIKKFNIKSPESVYRLIRGISIAKSVAGWKII